MRSGPGSGYEGDLWVLLPRSPHSHPRASGLLYVLKGAACMLKKALSGKSGSGRKERTDRGGLGCSQQPYRGLRD